MPGLALWMTRDAGDVADRFDRALRSRRHDPGIAATTVLSRPGLCLGFTAGDGYPIRVIESADHVAVVEGRIAGQGGRALDDEVLALARVLLPDARPDGRADVLGDDADAEVARFADRCRGDWAIAVVRRDGRDAAVFSDPLGRLPLFLCEADGHASVVREPGVSASLHHGLPLDVLGVGELLWLGYPLGSRTLLEGVRALPPGARVRLRRRAGLTADLVSLSPLDLSPGDVPGDLDRIADELVERFLASARETASLGGEGARVLSLSGGQDSRAVAAAMVRAGISLRAATQHDASGASRRDEEVAQQVAAALGIPLEAVAVPGADVELRRRLARWKDGLNIVAAARLLPYVDALADRFGAYALYLTGDGGDKTLPDLARVAPGAGPDRLAAAIERHNARLDAASLERWLGLPAGALRDALRSCIAAYPEADAPERYAHFLLAERTRRRLFDAEDRVRFRLWPASPFYGRDFFRPALAVPRDWKRDYRLFARFQERLSPACAAIPDASTPWPVGSARFRLRRRLAGSLSLAPALLRRSVWRLRGVPRFRLDAGGRGILERASREAGPLAGALAPDRVEALLAGAWDPEVRASLWTVAHWLEQGGPRGLPPDPAPDATPDARGRP